jgi:hypothetical protein
MLLAQNGVHGAMAGYTGFSVGLVVRYQDYHWHHLIGPHCTAAQCPFP